MSGPKVNANTPITVVVPTRNRGHTIADTIKSCVAQDADCQFLISDNCSEDETEAVVRSFKDPRITYIRTDRVLSMEASFDFALSKTPEGYVYTMGGDDALCPGGIRRLREVIAETEALVIRPRLINYHWDNYPDATHQQIATNVPIGEGWQWKDSWEFLQGIAQDLMRHAHFYEHAPAFYHGCVHSSLLSKVWPAPEPIIRSKVPDMYSGVLIGAQISRYVLLDTPVSLNAMSCSSNGVSQFLRQGLDKGDGHSFWADVDYPYEPELVRQSTNKNIVLAMPLLLADQFLKVKKLGHKVPEIALDHVITATIRGACRWYSRDQYEGALEVARETASIHGLEALAEKTIQENPFRERPRNRRQTTFDTATQIYRVLDLAPLGATGAESAGVVINKVRSIHAEQKALITKARLEPDRFNLAEILSSEQTLRIWLLIRSQQHIFTGHALVVQDEANAALTLPLLTAPSLTTEVSYVALNQAPKANTIDTLLFAPVGTESLPPIQILNSLRETGSVFVVRAAEAKSQTLEGWQCTREPLLLTNAEHRLLSLGRRLGTPFFKAMGRIALLPLIPRLRAALNRQRSAAVSSGLMIERWSRQSPQKAASPSKVNGLQYV